MAGGGLLSAEVARPRGAHRRHGRHGCHRLLRDSPRFHPPLPRNSRRLPRAYAHRRRRPWSIGIVHQTLGSPVSRRPRCPPRGTPRVPIRPRCRGPRHRRSDIGRTPQPERHSLSDRHRQDRGLGPDHRLGRFRRTGGSDRPGQRGVRLAPSPGARPQSRRCPHGGSYRHRIGDRGHLRSAPRWSGTGHRDPLPGRLRRRSAPPLFHRLHRRLRHLRCRSRVHAVVRFQRRLPLQ